MFDLNQLRQLVAFADCETLSKASETLLISQPALSRSMKKLENDLDAALFTRKKNRIALTETGKLAVSRARQVLDCAEDMAREIEAREHGPREVRIGVRAPGALLELRPRLAKIYPRAQVVPIVAEDAELINGLLSKKYDIIATMSKVAHENIVSRDLCEENLTLSLPPKHKLTGARGAYFGDLAGETLLLLSGIGYWHDLCARKMPLTRLIIEENRKTHDELAQASHLLSLSSNLVAKHFGKLSGRVEIDMLDSEAHVKFYVSLLKSRKKLYPVLNAPKE